MSLTKKQMWVAGAIVLTGIWALAMLAHGASAACEPDQIGQPSALRVHPNPHDDAKLFLTWNPPNQTCGNNVTYAVEIQRGDDPKWHNLTITGSRSITVDKPDGDAIFRVTAIVDGTRSATKTAVPYRGKAPEQKAVTPPAGPAVLPPRPSPDIWAKDDEINLVCWYEQNGAIHSVTGVRECTKAEIQHALGGQRSDRTAP